MKTFICPDNGIAREDRRRDARDPKWDSIHDGLRNLMASLRIKGEYTLANFVIRLQRELARLTTEGQTFPPVGWYEAEAVAKRPSVDTMLTLFCNVSTHDNAVALVQDVIEAYRDSVGIKPSPQVPPDDGPLETSEACAVEVTK